MYCRNCAHDVHDKAIACPKCGVNPKSENKFCPSCGHGTEPNQIACTSCGVSLSKKAFNIDTSKVEAIEVKDLIKNKTFKLVAVLVIIAISIYAYVQHASHLSNGKAEELISEKLNLPSPITEPIQYGLINYGWDSPTKELALQESGLFTCVKDTGSDYSTYQIDMTDKGSKYKISDSTDTEGRKYHVMKIAERTFGEILNIRETSDGKEAVVEFTILYKNITPIGEVMGISENNVTIEAGEATYKTTANFKKTDEGWTLKNSNTIKNVLEDLQKMQRGY